ncbi:MAG: hypothetical protein IJV25_04015 [Prevotella sp.]|nr:hypothetical protein [Prevotella sp.]MBQ9649568.1 hypothetical protein [Prevotella sp.]
MRQMVGLMMAVLLMTACGGRRMSPEELQHKLDSVKALEAKEKLALQGVNLESSDNLMKLFYDSLEIQPLPLSYNEDYIRLLPSYKPVTDDIVAYMNLVECRHPKAIALPETIGAKLIIIAADETDGQYSLWLYSLDDDYFPVDKLCLFSVDEREPEEYTEINQEEFLQYFSITSDYMIRLMDYSKEGYQARLEEVYEIDASRKFILRTSREE